MAQMTSIDNKQLLALQASEIIQLQERLVTMKWYGDEIIRRWQMATEEVLAYK